MAPTLFSDLTGNIVGTFNMSWDVEYNWPDPSHKDGILDSLLKTQKLVNREKDQFKRLMLQRKLTKLHYQYDNHERLFPEEYV